MTGVNQTDALGPLIDRRSTSHLAEPASTGEQSQNILRTSMRAPDHKFMQLWHFFVIEGEGRERLSAVLEQGTIAIGSDNKVIDKARNTSFHAPLIITVVVRYEENHRVPHWEQGISAGCAVMAMQMATVVRGSGGIWRSGALAESPVVHETFGCREQDKTVGFLYFSTPRLEASMSISVPDPTPLVTCF